MTITTDNGTRPLIDIEEAARITGTTARMIRRLIGEGKLPRVKIGRYVRIRPDDLDAFVVAHTTEATR